MAVSTITLHEKYCLKSVLSRSVSVSGEDTRHSFEQWSDLRGAAARTSASPTFSLRWVIPFSMCFRCRMILCFGLEFLFESLAIILVENSLLTEFQGLGRSLCLFPFQVFANDLFIQLKVVGFFFAFLGLMRANVIFV